MKRYRNLIKGLAFVAVLSVGMVSCKASKENTPAQNTSAKESRVDQKVSGSVGRVSEDDAWTFANIPLPEKSNPPRFVSNPDGVLSPDTEAEMNNILLHCKAAFGMESCVVVVNHVDNSDVEAFAYALFDNFPDNNDMMVIVMAYQDHGVRLELGKDLESKLSEVECQQLLDNILIPYLKEDKPDEGMIALLEGVYNKMSKKM